jgi:hypothetical protein
MTAAEIGRLPWTRSDKKMDIGFLALFKPDGGALVRQLATHVDDQMLAHVAEADYAGTEDHLAALRRIRDDGIIDRPLRWVPREVLELARWTDPDHPDEWEGRHSFSRPQRHWLRAFCCAVLLHAYGDKETREIEDSGYGLALIQLLESLRCLDAGLERETMAALAWLITRLNDDPTDLTFISPTEAALIGVGLLSVAARSKGAVPDAAIVALADWLIAREAREAEVWNPGQDDYPGRWLFRTDHIDMLDQKWMALGDELAAFQDAGPAGDAVRSIGKRMQAGDRNEDWAAARNVPNAR